MIQGRMLACLYNMRFVAHGCIPTNHVTGGYQIRSHNPDGNAMHKEFNYNVNKNRMQSFPKNGFCKQGFYQMFLSPCSHVLYTIMCSHCAYLASPLPLNNWALQGCCFHMQSCCYYLLPMYLLACGMSFFFYSLLLLPVSTFKFRISTYLQKLTNVCFSVLDSIPTYGLFCIIQYICNLKNQTQRIDLIAARNPT